MRTIIVVILFLVIGFVKANELKKGLQGEWICTKVTNEAGELTVGRYGRSGIFVGFTFDKGKLYISGSPFDPRENELIVQYREDHLEFLSAYGLPIGELKWYPKKTADGWIIAGTNSVFGEVFYHLKPRYTEALQPTDEVIEMGFMRLIKVKTEYAFTSNMNFYYQAWDSAYVDRPYPVFKAANYQSFGLYLTDFLDFPRSLTDGIITKELIVDFKVTKKGMQEIHFRTQLSPEITGSMLKILTKSARKWSPARYHDRIVEGSYRLRFQFGSVQSEQDVLYFNID